MQVWFLLGLVLTAVIIVVASRRKRDQRDLAAHVRERGGEMLRAERVRKGHPFPDTGRGWWAWRIDWRDRSDEHTSWALTTRDGIKEWRD